MKRLQIPPFLLHFLLLSLLPSKATTSSPGTQAQALITWRNSFEFYYSTPTLDSWSQANLNNLCNWTAIVCNRNTKTVSKIDLSNLQISATLTHFNFTPFLNLTHFNLNQNGFEGPIPSAIGNLSRLSILDLGNNGFEGPIPSAIGNLSRLSILDLGNNFFEGPIPSAIGNLSSLSILDLGNNLFQQEIPAEIGLLTELEYLSFYNNWLDGTIPYQLSNLQKKLGSLAEQIGYLTF